MAVNNIYLEILASFSGDRQRGVSKHLPFEAVRSVAEVEERARSGGKPVMLDFYADWCITCKEMERKTFSDPRIQQALSGWTLLRADVTANSRWTTRHCSLVSNSSAHRESSSTRLARKSKKPVSSVSRRPTNSWPRSSR